MSKRSFNVMSKELEAKVQKQREKAAAAMDGGEVRLRPRINKGMNVFWLLPGIGDTYEAVNHMLIHYGPFHRCSRVDPIADPSEKDGFKKDRNFGGCIRCKTAWDTWSGAGRPEGEPKNKFRSDMENHQAVFQVFDFSPFFRDSDGLAEANGEVFDKYFGIYLKIAQVEDYDERVALAKEEQDKGLPEDVATAAIISPGLVFSNARVGKDIEQARRLQQREDGEDPLMNPAGLLLQIHRTEGTSSFIASNGERRYEGVYNIRFTAKGLMDGWEPNNEQLLNLALARAVDIYNIEPEGDTLQDRAYALEKLGEAEILQLLADADHSFTLETNEAPFSDDGGAVGSPDDFSVDDVDVATLSIEDHAVMEELKNKFNT